MLDLDVLAVDANGDGLARQGARLVAIPFTIPGERVRVDVDRVTGRAEAVEILRASPHRVVARCPHFGPCGGCAWQHIAYDEQLRLKTALVQRLLDGAAVEAPPVSPTLPGAPPEAPWGYRQKVHFVFDEAPAARGSRRDAGSLLMGHYARGSRRLVPVRECPVHDERGNALAFRMHRQFAADGVRAAGRTGAARGGRSPAGVLRSLAIRVGQRTGELMATVVVTDDGDRQLRTSTRRALAGPDAPSSVHVNVHPRADAFIFGRDTRCVAGAARLREEVAGVSFLVSPTAFFQTNIRAADTLVRLVMTAVPDGASVLDLYAGAGLFSLPLAQAGHQVVAVEENRAAVADGEASRQFNRIDPGRCRFIAKPVDAALRTLPRTDVAVLDPPRDGCSSGLLETLASRVRPSRLVYVSCNPEALARDLAALAPAGYVIRSVQPIDMFPHTAHVETVAVLERRDVDPRGSGHA